MFGSKYTIQRDVIVIPILFSANSSILPTEHWRNCRFTVMSDGRLHIYHENDCATAACYNVGTWFSVSYGEINISNVQDGPF